MNYRWYAKITSFLILIVFSQSCGDEEIMRVYPPEEDMCFVVDQANYEGSGFVSIAFIGDPDGNWVELLQIKG